MKVNFLVIAFCFAFLTFLLSRLKPIVPSFDWIVNSEHSVSEIDDFFYIHRLFSDLS